MSKICVAYGLCQLEEIIKLLKKIKEFTNIYATIYYRKSYTMSVPLEKDFLDLLPKADLFLYQPISKKYEDKSTFYLLTLLSDKCIRLGFPYVYNDGLSALSYSRNYEEKIFGHEDIIKYFENGLELKDVLDLLKNEKIEFEQFHKRFYECVEHMKKAEETLEIKLVPYILGILPYRRIFRIAPHPYNNFILDLMYIILDRLGISTEITPEIGETLLTYYPHLKLTISPYEKKFFNLTYEVDKNWFEIYSQFVDLIYKKWKNKTLEKVIVNISDYEP